jgi:cytochrome c oxidase assembly protein subunit 15
MAIPEIRTHHRPIAIWLLICCVTLAGMVVLGGATRLTGSGLSMVEWKPVTGVLPPLSQNDWEEVFDLYQQSPEFQLVNLNMNLEGFKGIFYLEYFHRLLGRLIGLIVMLPLIYFVVRRKIDRTLALKLAIMVVLGGLQGLLGWYMVQSGLADVPHVSQYRLTAHLGLAFLIYGYILWIAFDLLWPNSAGKPGADHRGLRRLSVLIPCLVFVTVLSGGFVAGLKAGLIHNTFPLMGGRVVPEGILYLDPAWRNGFENPVTVQFNHRILATLLFVLVPVFWHHSRRHALPRRIRIGFHLLLAILLIQVGLGIATLLLRVPVSIATIHQGGALALFSAALFLANQLGKGVAGEPG